MSNKEKGMLAFAWALTTTVIVLAVVAWGQGISWKFSGLSTYAIFPLLGLLAFSIMWSHYIVAVVRQYLKVDGSVVRKYFEITSFMTLLAILLHPGLLSWQLWRDGAGLPPFSTLNYRGPALRIYILIAMTAWLIFLSYELRRVFGKRSWWKFVSYASDFAMALIFIHALKLGGQLQGGWFRTVWWFYGVTLFGAIAYIYYKRFFSTPSKKPESPLA